MVRADLLDVIDKCMRINRKSERPFGGRPIVLIGDFLPLPPITTEEDVTVLQHKGCDVFYAFGAKCLRDANHGYRTFYGLSPKRP